MNYEEAARKLIVYSGGLAKGSLGTARAASVGEGPVLQYLVDNREPMNPSVLADTLGYTRPRMTRILDALVAKGHVERSNDPDDRRKVIVMATEEGKCHVESSSGNGVAAVASQLSALGDQNVIELLNVLEKAYGCGGVSPDERPAARVSPADGRAGRKGSARIARLERAMGFT